MERSTTYLSTLARALKQRAGFLVIAVLTLASMATARGDQRLTLRDGGQINGQPVDASHYRVLLAPGQPLTGAVNVTAYHDDASGAIWPAGATLTWGTREQQYWTVHNDIPFGSTNLVVNVNATAPTTPGLYNLVVANSPQYHTGQVMSATSAAFGYGHPGTWYDGNDVGFDWTRGQFQEACDNGRVTTTFRHPTLDYPKGVQSATAVELRVVGVPEQWPRPEPPELPAPSGDRGLVFITHGWNSNKGVWADEMKTEIEDRLSENGNSDDWNVVVYDWSLAAGDLPGPVPSILPGQAALNAEMIGLLLGAGTKVAGYEKVHFIAHSAGSWMIDSAANTIRSIESFGGERTTIHSTFLDAYTPLGLIGVDTLGNTADFAENYRDTDPYAGVVGLEGIAGRTLKQAFNVNVTDLNDDHTIWPWEEHAWPYKWYTNTIDRDYDRDFGYGFGLSMEMTNNLPSHDEYPRGDGIELPLETASVTPIPPVVRFGSVQSFEDVPYVTSDGGTVEINDTSLNLQTGSSVWITSLIEVTETVNLLTLDADFTGEDGAEGFLSVYWEGEIIGMIDERHASISEGERVFGLPGNFGPGMFELSFRVDPYTEVASRVIIDNVATGYVVPEPSSLILSILASVCGLAFALRRKRRANA